MTSTAADVLIDTIRARGVAVMFGVPGDGVHGIMEALRKWQKRIGFLQVRHEESVALMVCVYAKYTAGSASRRRDRAGSICSMASIMPHSMGNQCWP